MDELRQQIADLELHETEIIGRLNAAETDEEAKSITNELNFVRNRKAEVELELSKLQEKEQQRAEVIEEKTHAAEIPFAVAGIDFTDLPAEVITLIDAVVKADRRRLLNEHAIELEMLDEEARTNGVTIEKLRTIIEQGTAENASLIRDNGNLRDHTATLNTEISDLRSKLANAAIQIEEKDAEINRLKSEVEDIKRAQEYNSRQTEQVTANDEEKASITAALAAVKKLYTNKEDWGSRIKVDKPDGSFELVKRQEFENEWQAVDVPSFRPEDSASDSQNNNVPSAETVTAVEPPQFQTEGPVQTDILLREGTAEDATGVSRAEFQALVKRVEALEGNSVQEAA